MTEETEEASGVTRLTGKSARQRTQKSNNRFKPPKKYTGDIAELGTNVYMYGAKNAGNLYLKTTEAIADYVGREYGKAMRVLVKEGKESAPTEPNEPTEKDPSTVRLRKYESELKKYCHKKDEYDENEARVFLIIKGQCTLAMKNKIEETKNYKKIKEDADVPWLLEVIKGLAFAITEVQHEQWTMVQSVKRLMMMKQFPDE